MKDKIGAIQPKRNPIRNCLIKVQISALLALTFSLAVTDLVAQQPAGDLTNKSIEELMNIEVDSVYSASKYLQKVTEAPSSVTIVTADDIQKFGYRTLAEILRSVRGFYGTYDRNYDYVGVRGFARPGDYNTRVLLMVDGHRINDNVYDQAIIGTDLPIEIDMIERVEIIRGPSSSLYGTSAFFAVINVITKRGRDVNGIEASVSVESFATQTGRVSYGKKLKSGFEFLVSGSFSNSKGQQQLFYQEFNDPLTNNGIAQRLDDDQSGKFFANLAYRNFSLRAVYGSREKGIPTAAFGTVFNDPRSRTTDRRGYIDLQYERSFDNGVGLLARTSYDSYHYSGTYSFEYEDDGVTYADLNEDYTRSDWLSGEIQLTKRVLRKHKLTLGTEIRYNHNQDQLNYNLGTTDRYIDDRRQSKNIGFYFQDEFSIAENVIVNGGIRYDYHSDFGGTAKPRLALIYHPAQKSTIKLLYGEAFRDPNSYELYYGSQRTFRTNQALERETIGTSEVVFEQYLSRYFRFTASAYHYRLKGLITQHLDPVDELITFKNATEIRSKGLELEFESKLTNGLEARIAYSGQRAENLLTSERLTNSPTHLGKFNFSAPLLKQKLFANFELQYTSGRKTLNGAETEPLWLPNLTFLSKNITNKLDVFFGVYNIFDKKYGLPGSEEHLQNTIEQDGRTFRLKFTYRF
jgi:outer membrane receptor for ferrienterochelin and colicins